ncbi:Protein of unknown function [Roseovarius azorensis]|uniref:DUF3445 domain-containing protein n=1 Tax=Roseovarius azorensis TaxID=1287727 RepID=A0A1H7LRN6_9RHOB|nr:DUF3445 domain-containing protein [Roseovarius azorensis]SEL01368.1 Protein of unknown function [Roseovarius azorensis]
MIGIFQTSLPYDVTNRRPLPGIAPLDMAEWLLVDEAFGAQMAERARLLAERREDVLAVTPQGTAAAQELLDYVLVWLRDHAPGYAVEQDRVVRPDEVEVEIDRTDPMGTLGHLVQEDLCLMEKRGDEHVLTAAVLCFPASWRLVDKIGRPLITIHAPVAAYDPDIAQRVQRLFDGVREGRPLWRFNALRYADATLHQPRRRVQPVADAVYPYLRSERQCVLRLPETRACVFSIHTYVIAGADRLNGSPGLRAAI